MNSTTLYNTNRRLLISRFNGAEGGILSLEHTIQQRPDASRVLMESNGYLFYEKSASVVIFDRLMYSKNIITIRYAVHIESRCLIFVNIV